MSTLDELRVTCLTGAGQTGANAYLVSLGEWSMLLDAGASTAAHASWLERLEKTPDLVWLSHVHADHIGALTELRKRSSALQILMTPASKRLLPAALRYQDRRRVDTTGKTLAHLVTSLGMHHTHSIAIDAQTRAHLTAYPCGHMLGAASLYLEIERAEKFQRIFYLPDFSAHALPMTPRAAFPPYDENKRLDLLLMEGMLGTDKPSDKADFDANLAALVSQVTAHPCEGGQLFALAALGESCELAFALTGGEDGAKIIVHDYLRPNFAASERESQHT